MAALDSLSDLLALFFLTSLACLSYSVHTLCTATPSLDSPSTRSTPHRRAPVPTRKCTAVHSYPCANTCTIRITQAWFARSTHVPREGCRRRCLPQNAAYTPNTGALPRALGPLRCPQQVR